MGTKPQCQFYIAIDQETTFDVTRKLLGSHGENVKEISRNSGAKLRLRGKGSGFKEGPEQQESSDPLMLCISAGDQESYTIARDLTWKLVEDVYRQYRVFRRLPLPELRVKM